MNIKNIKMRANELLLMNKEAYLRVLFILLFVGLIPSVLSYIEGTFGSFLYLGATIIMMTFNHGYIVSSLKIVRNNGHTLNDQDAFVGLKRFPELFGTYLLAGFIQFMIILVLSIIAITVFMSMYPALYTIEDPFVILSMLAGPFLLFFIVLLVVSALMGAYLFAVPYLLEQYGYKGMDAVKESIQFIKGHVFDLIKLQLSYFLWFVVIVFISMGLSVMVSELGVLGNVISSMLTGVIGVLTYVPKYRLSLAIFFEEIAYYRYQKNTDEQKEMTYIMNQGENDVY